MHSDSPQFWFSLRDRQVIRFQCPYYNHDQPLFTYVPARLLTDGHVLMSCSGRARLSPIAWCDQCREEEFIQCIEYMYNALMRTGGKHV